MRNAMPSRCTGDAEYYPQHGRADWLRSAGIELSSFPKNTPKSFWRLAPGGACTLVRVSAGVNLKVVTWLILPVVICLSKRLSHACLSISTLIL